MKLVSGDKYVQSSLVYDALGNIYGMQGTISMWVKPEWDMKDPDIISYHDSCGPILLSIASPTPQFGHNFLTLGFIKGGSFRFFLPCQEGFYSLLIDYRKGRENWRANEWHHIVYTWDANYGVRLFDNGKLVGERLRSFEPTEPALIAIGANRPWGGKGGKVYYPYETTVFDEILILNRPVSQEEVILLANKKYERLSPAPEIKLSESQIKKRRKKWFLSSDSQRPTIPDGKLFVKQLGIKKLQWQYRDAGRMADGILDNGIRLSEGGLLFERNLKIEFYTKSSFNYLRLIGDPSRNTYLEKYPQLKFNLAKDSVVRLSIPEIKQTKDITIHFGKSSFINELQLFSLSPLIKKSGRKYYLKECFNLKKVSFVRKNLLALISPEDKRTYEISSSPKIKSVKISPYRIFNLAYPIEKAIGLKSFTISFRPVNGSATIRVLIRHPLDPERVYIDFDLQLSESTTLQMTVDGMYFPDNSNLWIQLMSTEPLEIHSPFYLTWSPAKEVIPSFVDREIRALNTIFNSRMSSNRFTLRGEKMEENPLYQRLKLLKELIPEHKLVNSMYYWGRFEPWPEFDFSLYEKKFPEAPRWAVYEKALLEEITKQPHWWLTHRQDETGYIVGKANQWNDVTKLLNKYSFLPLITDDKKLVEGIERYLDAHWNISGWVEDGYCKRLTDMMHSSEEASYLEPAMLLLKFADKKHIELADKTAKNIDYWMGVNKLGHFHFRSNYFTAKKILTEGDKGWEVSSCGRAISSALLLCWADPKSKYKEKLTQWMDSLMEDYYRKTEEKPARRLPTKIRFEDDKLSSHGWCGCTLHYFPYLIGAYLWTEDYKYLEPIEDILKKGEKVGDPRFLYVFGQPILTWRKITGNSSYDEILLNSSYFISSKVAKESILKDAFWQCGVFRYTIPCLWAFRITKDRKWLILALKHALRNSVRAFPIYTVIDPDTDRVYPWGRWVLPEMYLGGMVLNAEASLPYPTHAISWQDTGTDFAALVTENRKDQLTIEIFDFHPQGRKISFRTWSLSPGRYKLILQRKKKEGWDSYQSKELSISRGERILLSLTPQLLYRVKLERIK